ncbi:MAG TPA: FHA domain-containing protein [Streptosporangiaceae bacterium]|nr:FHA domain-containing protein [Streptosporangiaceae bacterium]
MLDGPHAGSRLAWRRAEVVLGREAAGSELFRDDASVSRRHAILRHGPDGTCLVEDMGSRNGTLVNEMLISCPTVLGAEDELRIGGTRLRLASAPADGILAAGDSTAETGAPHEGVAADDTAPSTGAGMQAPARKAGQLTLSILAAIAGTVLASALNGSPQFRLVAAGVGAAVPAFVTEPGRHQRHRATAAAVLMAVALFLTYGGATVFAYATQHAAIYPIPPAVPPPKPTGTSAPAPPPIPAPSQSPPTAPAPSPSPTPTTTEPSPSPSPSPSQTLTPSPTGSVVSPIG